MSAFPLYAIYGASGAGREVMPLARRQLEREGNPFDLVFVDDAAHGGVVNGHRVLSFDAFLATPASVHFVNVAIAQSLVRQRLVEKCAAAGCGFFSVAADSSAVFDDVIIGPGSLLCSFVLLTTNVRIGQHFHANYYSHVAHDCRIGDFVTFAPGVRCNGNVVIEDHAYIGSGAILRQGTPGNPLVIGRGAVVGMGAVVTKSVAPGVTVVGNPARPLIKA